MRLDVNPLLHIIHKKIKIKIIWFYDFGISGFLSFRANTRWDLIDYPRSHVLLTQFWLSLSFVIISCFFVLLIFCVHYLISIMKIIMLEDFKCHFRFKIISGIITCDGVFSVDDSIFHTGICPWTKFFNEIVVELEFETGRDFLMTF